MRLTGQRNKCPTCGLFFNSNYAFDKHRTGKFGNEKEPRRCMSEDEMLTHGMVKGDDGFWRGSAMPEGLHP